jgi:xylulokinase
MPAQPHGPAFIGIDVGTSSVKALMGAVGGERIAAFSAPHETARAAPGAAEQAPRAWMDAVEAALAQFAAHPRAGEVVAIGVTSQVNTHVFCDAALRPLAPAVTWQDTRPAAAAAALEAAIDPAAKAAALGAPIPIDASHALARMAWLAETDPALWARTAHVLLPKDYVIASLTGQIAGDPISAVGLVGPDLRYAPPLLGLVPRAAEVLPPLADPLRIVGRMAAAHPFAGVPVAAGTMDAWAGMFGLGVAAEGDAMYLAGTSEVLGLISATRAGAPGIVLFPPWQGINLHAGPTQSGGASLAWLARILGQSPSALSAAARDARLTRETPLFLPHLAGERAPLWDPSSRGAFAGMTGAHGAADLALSVMEGVAFAGRLALEAIEESGARRVDLLLHGGGGAASDTWCQVRANALGRRMRRAAAPECGASGAMVIAAVASGVAPDLAGAARALVAHDREFAPDPALAPLADARFEAFRALYEALGPVNRVLSAAPEAPG